MKSNLKFYWHIHQDMLCEPLTEPIKEINKPKEKVDLQLRLMKPVKGNLPKEFGLAYLAFEMAREKWTLALESWARMGSGRGNAEMAASFELDAAGNEWVWAQNAWEYAQKGEKLNSLHQIQCPNCPWGNKII